MAEFKKGDRVVYTLSSEDAGWGLEHYENSTGTVLAYTPGNGRVSVAWDKGSGVYDWVHRTRMYSERWRPRTLAHETFDRRLVLEYKDYKLDQELDSEEDLL